VNSGIRTPLRVCYSKELLQKIVKSGSLVFLGPMSFDLVVSSFYVQPYSKNNAQLKTAICSKCRKMV
jgi:hypothetical protein